MKKILATSCVLLASVAATNVQSQVKSLKDKAPTNLAQVQSQTQGCGYGGCSGGYTGGCSGGLYGYKDKCNRDPCGRVNYDYSCNHLRDTDCLLNSVDIYGPKVVLVNFDDRCELEEYEDKGIFLEVGDILIITARQDAAANQEWVIPEECEHYWDEGILAFLSFSDE